MILVDLYCCAGGTTKGYQRAGFTVVGVDIAEQPDYCGNDFVQMDAISFLRQLATRGYVRLDDGSRIYLSDIVAFAASPPCQFHTALTKGNRGRKKVVGLDTHVDYVPETRHLLDLLQKPYVIENVQGSTLRRDLTLCGLMFGLKVYRHRYFELGGWSMEKVTCRPGVDHKGHRVAGWRHGVKYEGDIVAVYGDGGGKGSLADWEAAMGIDWVTTGTPKQRKETLAEMIPPAYTEFIGQALIESMCSACKKVYVPGDTSSAHYASPTSAEIIGWTCSEVCGNVFEAAR